MDTKYGKGVGKGRKISGFSDLATGMFGQIDGKN
jgi:hypothetical protein